LFWSVDVDPSVLQVDAVPVLSARDDSFDLARFAAMVSVVQSASSGEHIAISDGYHRIRLDVVSGSLMQGPVVLRHHLGGIDRLDQKLLALRQLIALHRHGRFVSSLFPVGPQTTRIVMALRAYDALQAGASQRDIAIALFGNNAVDDDWKAGSDYLRLRVRRLVTLACRMASGEWRHLLR
jgi:hypothetical protein